MFVLTMAYVLHKRSQEKYRERLCEGLIDPASFSLHISITDALWSRVEDLYQRETKNETILSFFERDLHSQVRHKLERYREEQEPNANVDPIVIITWVNTSGKRIQSIMQRAECLKNNQAAQAKVHSDTIEKMIDTEYDSVRRPYRAYITFKSIED